MATLKLKYKSIPESENQMLDAVLEFVVDNQVNDNTRHKFMLCISEAFTNALTHGNNFNPEKDININIVINEWVITADIIDEGKGGLDNIKCKNPPNLMSENGRGVDLMRHFCTSVDFQQTSLGGLKVSFKFELENEVVK